MGNAFCVYRAIFDLLASRSSSLERIRFTNTMPTADFLFYALALWLTDRATGVAALRW